MSIEIILPVRDMAEQLAGCLDTLLPQLDSGDTITVVDDGSTDGTRAVAIARDVRVAGLRGGTGPYAARHAAAKASCADQLLFIDARCRALPGLLDRHRQLLADERVALSCTDGEVLSGPSMAERVAAVQQRFRLDAIVGVPGRLDYYATANLGVRRSAYEAVGGFRSMRSGGDADLCWRIQLAGAGSLAADRAVLMHWQPRDDLRDLASQIFRYGGGAALLESLFSADAMAGAASGPDQGRVRGLLAGFTRLCRYGIGSRRDVPATTVAMMMQLVYQAGYLRGRRRLAELPQPTFFADSLQLDQLAV